MSYCFIKIKKFNEYSIDDLMNNTISFGLFSIFTDQSELKGKVNSKYLNAKYNDDSITDENVVNVIANHINSHY